MATFDVTVVTLDGVFEHPQADRLELGAVAGYRIVVAKGAHQAGDTVAYIPEGAVLPDDLILELGLVGKLAGSQKNRLKAVRLRGELSQGLIVPARAGWTVGQSVMDELGIIKYEPVIPPAMAGEVYALELHEVVSFDLENIKAYPQVFEDGEMVVMTEKVHGTFTMIGAVPSRMARDTDGHRAGGRSFVSSKGLMHRRLGLKHNEANARNIYLRMAEKHRMYDAVETLSEELNAPVFVLGETYGAGVQDLSYNAKTPDLAVFSVVVGDRFVNDDELDALVQRFGWTRASVVYRGPFSMDVVLEHTKGRETMSGNALHIREGVVVVPAVERRDRVIGRVALKSISEDYLLRKDATEYT